MRIIHSDQITSAVARLCVEANRYLPESVKKAVDLAADRETNSAALETLLLLKENAAAAESSALSICQDTGLACVFADIGRDAHIDCDIYEAIDEGVRQGYRNGFFRNSVVSDPLRRVNTGDNTPASVSLRFVASDKVTLTVAPKGFGSENMSAVKMLKPSDGRQGVIDFVTETVRIAGGNPCPPTILGVGIGGTFDSCALMAKRALLRDAGLKHEDPFYADLEDEILASVNCLGIGAMGFGGDVTALSCAIIAAPTHIAGLPCAVNVSCHVTRHATAVI